MSKAKGGFGVKHQGQGSPAPLGKSASNANLSAALSSVPAAAQAGNAGSSGTGGSAQTPAGNAGAQTSASGKK